MMRLPSSCRDHMIAHAQRDPSRLACGLVAGIGSHVTKVFPCQDTAVTADAKVLVGALDVLDAGRAAAARGWDLLGVYCAEPGAANPPATVTRSWFSDWLVCFVVSPGERNGSAIRAYRVHGGSLSEEAVTIRPDVALTALDGIQEIRGAFIENRMNGWWVFLERFRNAAGAGDGAVVQALLAELETGGYEHSTDEWIHLSRLRGWWLFRTGGYAAMWSYYADLESAAPDDAVRAEASFQLGVVFQAEGQLPAAQARYLESLAAWTARGLPAFAQRARDAVAALELEEATGVRHPYFEGLLAWLHKTAIDPRQDVLSLASAAIRGDDWRRARAALLAIDVHSEPELTVEGLSSGSPAARIAALSTVPRDLWSRRPLIDPITRAAGNESVLVRQEAIRRLGAAPNAGGESERLLVSALQSDPDAGVRVTAAQVLGHVGTRDALSALASVPDAADIMGTRLPHAAALAAEAIRQRYGDVVPPPPGPQPAPPPPPRTASQKSQFRKMERITTTVMIGIGTAIMGSLDMWAAAGYLLYLLMAKGLLEPRYAPYSFFADKPCSTSDVSPLRLWRRRGFGSHLSREIVFLPVRVLPLLVGLLLLARGFSWTLAILAAIGTLLCFTTRSSATATMACQFCGARDQCTRWRDTIVHFQPKRAR